MAVKKQVPKTKPDTVALKRKISGDSAAAERYRREAQDFEAKNDPKTGKKIHGRKLGFYTRNNWADRNESEVYKGKAKLDSIRKSAPKKKS